MTIEFNQLVTVTECDLKVSRSELIYLSIKMVDQSGKPIYTNLIPRETNRWYWAPMLKALLEDWELQLLNLDNPRSWKGGDGMYQLMDTLRHLLPGHRAVIDLRHEGYQGRIVRHPINWRPVNDENRLATENH